ncbi:hypothetical protein DYU05_00565 [Mucilaginibacter terrenus]|uniref:Uncharacterized protein n=1 Tax=Mucilaginibacter terrenus TaxID=2482727 RepID=A0A3E2NT15_9SPHI|nr:hypothetical protein [Mucilaginibacter terrenus]RFZ84162.1 hypothetical protein DYU05_00565 [Mucilaginibacter terrenus]
MTEIRIPKSVTPAKVSSLYKAFIIDQRCIDVNLVLPSEINRYTFGLLADLLRFIITLNSLSEIKKLTVDAQTDELDDFYDQEYAYPIISLLWNKSLFVDNKGNNIKAQLRERQNRFLFKMNSLSKIKGNKFILTHTDHL